jgi:ATP-dependent Lon protease
MEIVEFTGYTELEKLAIARRYLLPRQLQEAGLGPEELELADDAMREVISRYTREAGVRQLERELGKIWRGKVLESSLVAQQSTRSMLPPKTRSAWQRACTTPPLAATSCSSKCR